MKQKESNRVISALKSTAHRFIEHRCLVEARSLSYVTLLSFVPFFTVILVLFSRLSFYPHLKDKLLFGISSSLLPDKSSQITGYFDSILVGGRSVGVIGTILSIAIAFSLLLAFSRVVNSIWGTKRSDRLFFSFLKLLAVIVTVPALIITTFMLQNYVSIQRVVQWLLRVIANGRTPNFPSIRFGFTRIFSLVLNWGMLAFLYGFIPHTKVKPCPCVFSGISAGTLWWLMRLGLNLYIRYIPQMNLLYGSLAFFPVFLIWVYGSWIIILFGVELNYTFHFMRKYVTLRKNMPGRPGFSTQ